MPRHDASLLSCSAHQQQSSFVCVLYRLNLHTIKCASALTCACACVCVFLLVSPSLDLSLHCTWKTPHLILLRRHCWVSSGMAHRDIAAAAAAALLPGNLYALLLPVSALFADAMVKLSHLYFCRGCRFCCHFFKIVLGSLDGVAVLRAMAQTSRRACSPSTCSVSETPSTGAQGNDADASNHSLLA